MNSRLLFFTALALLSGLAMVSAQPGPVTTVKNGNLVLPASTLLTNGLPGLSGPPVTLMVGAVQANSMQGGTVSLVANQAWARRYNGPANNEDQGLDVTADGDGNIIVGGYSLGIGSGIDYLTIKYTPDGLGLWTNRYDGPAHGTDQIRMVAVDGAGGVYVAGDSGGNIVTIKYSSNGTPIWTNSYTPSGFFLLGGLAVDVSGNAYVLPLEVESDFFVTIKYDVSGQAAWTNRFRSSATSTDSAFDIAVDAAGNIFVTGGSFDANLGGNTSVTIKYGGNGSALWTNRASFVSSGTRVIVDPQGNVIVAGETHGPDQDTYAVIKYSNLGATLWTNLLAGGNYGGGGVPEIATDAAGNVFLVGGTAGATTGDYTTIQYSSAGLPLWTNRFLDPNAGAATVSGAATDNAGNLYWSLGSASPGGVNYNYVTVKYAAHGAAVWTNRYNGPANASDDPRGMAADKAGGVYVTGTSSSGGAGFSALDWATVKYTDNLRYAPPNNYVGPDTITFTAFDRFGNSAPGTVSVEVLPAVTVVAPDDYAFVAGNTGLNTLVRSTGLARTYQMQFTPDALGGLPVGARITGLRFRLSANATAGFPSSSVTWLDYEVSLSQAANPITSMSTQFQVNMLNPVLVKYGTLAIGANHFSFGSTPNRFSTLLTLDVPYVYQGGDLVMYFTHIGSDSTENAFLDAASAAAPGYGTAFRAISANAFSASSGTAASATIVEIVFAPPVTQSITRSGNQAIIQGSGGLAGATYRILTSTNVALPAAQWTPIITNRFGPSGDLGYTNVIQASKPAQYFRVMLP